MHLVLLLAACGGDRTDDTPAGTTVTTSATTTTETADTGESGSGLWQPDGFTIWSQFAVSDGRLRTWLVDGVEYAPFVAIELAGDLSAADPETCTIYMIVDEPLDLKLEVWEWEDATEEAKGQSMQHMGWIVPDDARVETEGCVGLDIASFGDPVENVTSKLWGVGVGELRVDVEARFDDTFTSGFWSDAHTAGNLIGGSWNSDVWEPAIWGSHIAIASELGAGGNLEVDAKDWPVVQLPSDDVLAIPASVPEAHYLLTGILYYDAKAYLY